MGLSSAVPKSDSEIRPAFSTSVVAGGQETKPRQWNTPSVPESIGLWLIAAVVFILAISHFQSYGREVDTFGDNPAYIGAAKAILQHWDLSHADIKQFWGLPYLVALLSLLHLSVRYSFLLACMGPSLGSMLLVRRLWGEWIALFFALLNISWVEASYLGGSEPLFLLLLLVSFWLSRREQWLGAAVMAALATVVRPLGFLALLGIGVTLLLRKEIKKAAACTAVAALIGMLYLLPFWIFLHDPLFQIHHYKQEDWHGGSPIGWPFHALAVSFLHNHAPWSNVIFTAGWVVFTVLGFWAMIRGARRLRIGERPAEYLFAFSYLIFVFCYNSERWSRAEFPRFVVPVLPFLLVALERWLPKRRFVVYPLAVVSAVLGAASALGVRNVMAALHH